MTETTSYAVNYDGDTELLRQIIDEVGAHHPGVRIRLDIPTSAPADTPYTCDCGWTITPTDHEAFTAAVVEHERGHERAQGLIDTPPVPSRPATADERCTCGRPATVVYETEAFGDVPHCGAA